MPADPPAGTLPAAERKPGLRLPTLFALLLLVDLALGLGTLVLALSGGGNSSAGMVAAILLLPAPLLLLAWIGSAAYVQVRVRGGK